jgi:hypothetical protein
VLGTSYASKIAFLSSTLNGERRPVRKIAECACDQRRCRVVNHRENCADRQDTAANILKGKLRTVIDGHAVGDDLISDGTTTVHLEFVCRVGVEGERAVIAASPGVTCFTRLVQLGHENVFVTSTLQRCAIKGCSTRERTR